MPLLWAVAQVSTDGQLKIADFGVAEELDRYGCADTCYKSRGSPAFQVICSTPGRWEHIYTVRVVVGI